MFSAADWAVVALYLLVMVAIGVYLMGRQKTKKDYFLGGREISWFTVALSIVATETSALTFIGVPAMAFGALKFDDGVFSSDGGNMMFMQIIIGYIIARVLVSLYMVDHYFKGDVYTPYQVLTRAFGPQSRYVAAVMSLIGMTLAAGVRIYVTAIPLMIIGQTIWDGWGINHSIFLFTIISLLYTAIGGITAVIWTEMVQFFIFVLGGLFAVFYIPTLIEGGWTTVFDVGAERFAWFNSGLVGWGDVQNSVTAAGGEMGFWAFIGANIKTIFGGDFNIWMGLIGATIGVMVSHGVDQLNVQRVLACKSARDGKKALIFSALIIGPQFFLFLTIGAVLWVFYVQNGFNFGDIMPWDPTKIDEVTGAAPPRADFIFPVFIITQIPPVIKGFMIAGILAAAMSSVSGALSAMSSVAIMDLYRPLTGKTGETEGDMKKSRWSTVVAGAALIVVAILSQNVDLIFNLAFKLVGLVSGGILGAVLWGIWTKRGYSGPVIAGMVCSFLFMSVLNIVMANTPVNIHWPWHAPIGFGVCISVAWLASIGLPTPTDRSIDQRAEGEI